MIPTLRSRKQIIQPSAATKNTERNNAAPTYTGFILISVDFSCEKFCPRRTTPNVSIMIARNKKILFHIFGLYSYVS